MVLSSKIYIRLTFNIYLAVLSFILPLPAHAGSIASIEQIGNSNYSTLTQDGFENEGKVVQAGEDNETVLTQENPQDLSGSSAIVEQGVINGCVGCVATVKQTGADNFAGVFQDGEVNQATVDQNAGGDDNFAVVGQFGDNNKATFNQEGDGNTGLSAQVGNDNGFIVNQLNGDNFISVNQFGGVGSEESGGPITVTQEGGGFAVIVQESVLGN